jgi:isocitrate/isopropylmalate dehydrogenase
VLDHAATVDPGLGEAARAIRASTLGTATDGVRTFDLGGEASTSEVVDEVVRRVASALGR